MLLYFLVEVTVACSSFVVRQMATVLWCVRWQQLCCALDRDGFVEHQIMMALLGGRQVILVAEETVKVSCMKKSTMSSQRFMFLYDHGVHLIYGYSVM